jgi:hypothetical protein
MSRTGSAAAVTIPRASRQPAHAGTGWARHSDNSRPLYKRFKSGLAGGFRQVARDHRYSRPKAGFMELGVAKNGKTAIPKNSREGPAYWVMTLILLRAGELPGL